MISSFLFIQAHIVDYRYSQTKVNETKNDLLNELNKKCESSLKATQRILLNIRVDHRNLGTGSRVLVL